MESKHRQKFNFNRTRKSFERLFERSIVRSHLFNERFTESLRLLRSGWFFRRLNSIRFFAYQTFSFQTLGNAPKWCTFLDNITEELEEKPADTGETTIRFVKNGKFRFS